MTAETEAKLRHLAPPPPNSTASTKKSYVATLNAHQEDLQTELDSCPSPLPALPTPSGGGHVNVVTHEDVLQTRIIIAWISSLKEDWDAVLEIIPGEEEVGEGFVGTPEKNDYIQIVRIKALVLKGIALSKIDEKDHSLPFQLYRAATKLPETYTKAQRTYPVFLQWTEKAMAHYAMASYQCWLGIHTTLVTAPPSPEEQHFNDAQDGAVGVAIGKTIVDEATVAGSFRSFHKYINALASGGRDAGPSTPLLPGSSLSTEKDAERRELYYNYFKFLSLLLLPPSHPSAPTSSSTSAGTREDLQNELKVAQKEYEGYLRKGLGFPHADQYHEVIGEWVDQVFENWRVSGGSGEEASPVVEILYRAAQKTFHSPRILRYLFQTLTATGNFQDAISALETYIELIEKAKERIAKGQHEQDFDSDKLIFQTAVEGIRVLCKFTKQSEKALSIAERMETWADEWNVRDKDILGEMHRGIGIANATWSATTPDGDLRPAAQSEARKAFKKALSYDSADVQGWYGLAMIEIEMGELESGMESTRRGLGALKHAYLDSDVVSDTEEDARDYKRSAVSLLHLLALSMTAQEDFDNAEKVCQNAFDIVGLADFDVVGHGREAVADFGVIDKLAILELMMTQLAITEAVEDSQAAIPMADKLLELYGTLFDGTHLIQRVELDGSQDQLAHSTVQSTRPPTTASRRSRFLGLRKKQFSASSSNLPHETETSPPSRGGTLRKRPKSGHQSLGFSSSHHHLGFPHGGSQTVDAPKIEVTDTSGPSASEMPKAARPVSVSGGKMRRMRSLGSIRLKSEPKVDDSPTPPLPSTESSSINGSHHKPHHGKDPHLFHSLKTKLHKHQSLQAGSLSAADSTISLEMPLGALPHEPESTAAPTGPDTAGAVSENPQGNLKGKLPLPLGAIGRSGPEDTDRGKTRSVRRPTQLPEPKLSVDAERKQVLGGLRKVWLCVASLYRRAHFYDDSAMALEEATSLVDADGDGEADVLAEVRQ